jgi:transposase-like protein
VESYHRQIRKVTKNKGVFTNDTALEKLVYPAYRNIKKEWTRPLANWGQSARQFAILFSPTGSSYLNDKSQNERKYAIFD